MTFLIILLISIMVSTLGTLAGFGGAIFLVPILMLFFGYPMDLAVGSVIIALFPSSLLSTILSLKNRTIDFRVGLMLEAPVVVGTFIGAILVSIVPVLPLKIAFCIFVSALGISMMLGKTEKDREEEKRSKIHKLNKVSPSFIIKNKNHFVAYQISAWMIGFFGIATGIISGLFGVGGGFMKTPIMIKIFKMPHKIATSTALFMIVITSLSASISHYFLGNIEIERSIPIIIGFLIGAVMGKMVNKKVSSRILERV
ncbi:MAG TPA: sulfite exporter TauE/SafE family protein, partial [Salinimicrobium sp.]|nr:sulfite exporter TauE/SafE family protein [Salinimicrobium sp.]